MYVHVWCASCSVWCFRDEKKWTQMNLLNFMWRMIKPKARFQFNYSPDRYVFVESKRKNVAEVFEKSYLFRLGQHTALARVSYTVFIQRNGRQSVKARIRPSINKYTRQFIVTDIVLKMLPITWRWAPRNVGLVVGIFLPANFWSSRTRRLISTIILWAIS